jgi:hypothetical protein
VLTETVSVALWPPLMELEYLSADPNVRPQNVSAWLTHSNRYCEVRGAVWYVFCLTQVSRFV